MTTLAALALLSTCPLPHATHVAWRPGMADARVVAGVGRCAVVEAPVTEPVVPQTRGGRT